MGVVSVVICAERRIIPNTTAIFLTWSGEQILSWTCCKKAVLTILGTLRAIETWLNLGPVSRIVHIEDQGLDTSCCDHQKPFQGRCDKDLGRRDPEALDELAEPEAKLYQQDTGLSVCVSSGRFDMQLCVKRLSAMMSKHRKMGDLRLSRYVEVCRKGTQKLSLRFDHLEYGDIVRIPVDSNWSGTEERYSTHAGREFQGGHLVDSWVASRVQQYYAERVHLHQVI